MLKSRTQEQFSKYEIIGAELISTEQTVNFLQKVTAVFETSLADCRTGEGEKKRRAAADVQWRISYASCVVFQGS